MARSAGKNISFVTGMALVVLGAFELYMGLTQTGAGEAAFVEIARSFMLLFPGYAFLAYSLHPNRRLTSHSVKSASGGEDILVTLASTPVNPAPENVVAFPRRPGLGSPKAPGFRTYGK